jgi:hypothetical protein
VTAVANPAVILSAVQNTFIAGERRDQLVPDALNSQPVGAIKANMPANITATISA